MILGWSSFKVVQMVPVCCISRSQELKIDFLSKNLKNLLVRNHWTDFNIILQKCSFCDPLPRLFKPFGFVKKHGHQGVGLIFPIIYIYIENFKNLLVRNHYTDFNIILQKCSFDCDYIENFKNLLVRNHWTHFNIIFSEMFLWWSSTKIVQAIWIHQKTGLPGAGAYFPYVSL